MPAKPVKAVRACEVRKCKIADVPNCLLTNVGMHKAFDVRKSVRSAQPYIVDPERLCLSCGFHLSATYVQLQFG